MTGLQTQQKLWDTPSTGQEGSMALQREWITFHPTHYNSILVQALFMQKLNRMRFVLINRGTKKWQNLQVL